MRYLFGDSTPFPLPFDFLRTLEVFVTAGTRVVLLEHRARELAGETFAAHHDRGHGLDALAKFHDAVLRTLDGGMAPRHALVVEYAERLGGHATSLMHELRQRVREADDGDAVRIRSERDRTNEEVARHLCAFFQAGRLPTLGTRLWTTLVDGRPEARATLLHPGGVGVSFTLGTTKVPAWCAPRRISDLVGHLELVAGIKKSWIGGKVSREPVRLDDWIVGAAELGDAPQPSATIALRRRPDQKDTLILKLRREGGAFAADVEHPADPNAGQVPVAADPADGPQLERLWAALSAAFDEIVEERAVVTRVSLDGEDAIAAGLGQEVVARLVTVLAPTTLEIARRSPNARELSLKREGDGGRREELYLKRDALLEAIGPLPREVRSVFGPLALDDWPPEATRPLPALPLVATLDGREELTSLDFEDA